MKSVKRSDIEEEIVTLKPCYVKCPECGERTIVLKDFPEQMCEYCFDFFKIED